MTPYESAWLRTHSSNELRLAASLKKFLLSQTDSILSKIRERDGVWQPEIVFVPAEWDVRLINLVGPFLARTAFIGAGLGEIQAGKSAWFDTPWTKDSIDNILITLPPNVQAAIRAAIKDTLKEPYWQQMNLKTMWRLRSAFAKIMADGLNLHEQVQAIKKVLGNQASGERALRTARTEVTGALNAGTYAVQLELADEGSVSDKTWLATLDSVTRASHVEAHGQKVKINALFRLRDPKTGDFEYAPYPGFHKLSPQNRVHCLLPDQMVEGNFYAATKSRYSGEVSEIITRFGRRLSVTPNHRILTSHGLIPARELQEGDQLISYNCQIDMASIIPGSVECPDKENYKPTAIEDVFKTFLLRLGSGSVEVRRADMDDFNGDARSFIGDIEVVFSDWKLLDQFKSSGGQESENNVLHEEFSESLFEDRQSYFSHGVHTSLTTALRRPSLATLPDDGISTFLEYSPFKKFCFGSAPDLYSSLSESAKQKRSTVATFVRQLLKRHARFIGLDQVLKIRNFQFSGHVYDLQSDNGLILANGIYISNCRCTTISSGSVVFRSRKFVAIGA